MSYGFWRMIPHELNMELLIKFFYKNIMKLDEILEGNIVAYRSHSRSKGCQ